jgi:hypothetical protein
MLAGLFRFYIEIEKEDSEGRDGFRMYNLHKKSTTLV